MIYFVFTWNKYENKNKTGSESDEILLLFVLSTDYWNFGTLTSLAWLKMSNMSHQKKIENTNHCQTILVHQLRP